jgi:peptide chain release factor 1
VQVQLDERDLEWSTCRGSGAGGQHRNVTASAYQVKHVPTGIHVRCESERSQHQNKATALATLRARIWELRQGAVNGARADARKNQVGSGMRGDKRRTIRTQDGFVNDHVTGRQWRYKDYVRGNW